MDTLHPQTRICASPVSIGRTKWMNVVQWAPLSQPQQPVCHRLRMVLLPAKLILLRLKQPRSVWISMQLAANDGGWRIADALWLKMQRFFADSGGNWGESAVFNLSLGSVSAPQLTIV